ncbi:MAG: hypothetical protein ACOYL9_02135 [Ilumatobacteraceae bacterium]
MIDPRISPVPTEEEAVAITAAVEALWPRPILVVDREAARVPSWRFSGRWWAKPLPSRRDRPVR